MSSPIDKCDWNEVAELFLIEQIGTYHQQNLCDM
jgi:hypothetical protein